MWLREQSRHSRHRERQCMGECLVCFVMLGTPGASLLCRTVSAIIYLDTLQLNLLIQLLDTQPSVGFQQDWLMLSQNLLACTFLGAELGAKDQLRGASPYLTRRRLISSCGRPLHSPYMNWSPELLLHRNIYRANAAKRPMRETAAWTLYVSRKAQWRNLQWPFYTQYHSLSYCFIFRKQSV
jgi:hypothetical protein